MQWMAALKPDFDRAPCLVRRTNIAQNRHPARRQSLQILSGPVAVLRAAPCRQRSRRLGRPECWRRREKPKFPPRAPNAVPGEGTIGIPDSTYGLGPVGNGQAAIGLTAVFVAVVTGLEGACPSCPREGIAGFAAGLAAGLREGFLAAAFLIFTAGLRAAFFFDAGIALLAAFFFTGFLAAFLAGFFTGFFITFFTFFLVAIFAVSIKN